MDTFSPVLLCSGVGIDRSLWRREVVLKVVVSIFGLFGLSLNFFFLKSNSSALELKQYNLVIKFELLALVIIAAV